MRGALFLLCLLPLTSSLAARLTPAQPQRIVHAERAEKARAALLISGDNEAFRKTTEAFLREFDGPVALFYTRERSHNGSLVAGIRAYDPQVLVVLGGHALKVANRLMPERPALVALSLDDGAGEARDAPLGGVSLAMAPRAEFVMYKLVLPELRSVGAFFGPRQAGLFVTNAQDALLELGVRLAARPIHESMEAFERQVAAALEKNDAIWLSSDADVMTPERFRVARELAWRAKKPLLCSTFALFAREGAFMAMAIDYDHVGSQLAAQAQSVGSGTARIEELGMQPPAGGKLILNIDVAKHLGVEVPARVRPLVAVVRLASGITFPSVAPEKP